MSADEQELIWKIENVRKSISIDWKILAKKQLSADERKAIEEHLNICNRALKDLVERTRSVSQKLKLENHQPRRQSWQKTKNLPKI
jgi:hypothetical protein